MKRLVLSFLMLVLVTSFSYGKILWEDSLYMRLDDGNYVWARLEHNSCYDIYVGSTNGKISGNASNCSDELNGSWSIFVKGNEVFYSGGKEKIIKKILDMNKNATKQKVGKIKDGSMVFNKRIGKDGIEEALCSKLTFSSFKLGALMGDENVKVIKGEAKVLVLEYYKIHQVIVDKHGNYAEHISDKLKKLKKGELKKINIIDGFYKIKDGSNNIYYIRESDLTI